MGLRQNRMQYDPVDDIETSDPNTSHTTPAEIARRHVGDIVGSVRVDCESPPYSSDGTIVVAGSGTEAYFCDRGTLQPTSVGFESLNHFSSKYGNAMKGQMTGIKGSCFLTESRYIALGTHMRSYNSVIWMLEIANLTSGNILCCHGHDGAVHKMTEILSPSLASSGVFVSGGGDQTLRLWNSETAEERSQQKCRGWIASAIRYSPSSLRVFAGGWAEIFSWDVETNAMSRLESARASCSIYGLAFDAEKETLFASAADWPEVAIYSPGTSLRPISVFHIDNLGCGIGELFFHPESNSLLVHDDLGRVHVYDPRKTDSAVRMFQVQLGCQTWISEFAQTGRDEFLSVNNTGELSRWTTGGKVLRNHVFSETKLWTVCSPDFQGSWSFKTEEVLSQRLEFLLKFNVVIAKIRVSQVLLIVLSSLTRIQS